MKIFLSYASEDKNLAEPIYYALSGVHDVFFDHDRLQGGDDFYEKIEREINECDMLIFLISPDSVRASKFTLAELAMVRAKWNHPKGRVLPVMLLSTPMDDVPNYLRAVTILEPRGNIAAEVRASVSRIQGEIYPIDMPRPPQTSISSDHNTPEKKGSGGKGIALLLLLAILAYLIFSSGILIGDEGSGLFSIFEESSSAPVGVGKDVIKNR